MDGLPEQLPTDPAKLVKLLEKQQRFITKQQRKLDRSEKRTERYRKKVVSKDTLIQKLEERLRELLQKRFGHSSERFDGQFSLFNEAELTDEEAAALAAAESDEEDDVTVPEHTRKRKKKSHALPEHLERVDVLHDLDESQKHCPCGQKLERIGEDIHEHLSIVPQVFYVTRHIRPKYACSCKECIRTATMPAQPLPACKVAPQMLAHTMVSKYLDGLPLYRQEKMAQRVGLELPRAKLARWIIDGSAVFQPLLNLLMDTFFGYDIAMSDDTRIQVLNEKGRNPENLSALWIRRGGPPDKPVVLVDYSASKSGNAAYTLLSEFRGTLVCDGASNFNQAIQRNGLSVALCNDHARRRFRRVYDKLSQEDKAGALGSIAGQGMTHYKHLYALEAKLKDLPPEQRLIARQEQALPYWTTFIAWAKQKHAEGVRHPGTMDALSYLIKHADNLQTYCHDGRLPISNIKSEHVAKTIAIARKNFMFSDSEAGAEASARVFGMIETARANGHNPQRYLSVLLTELPNISKVEDVEALLPWNLSPEIVAQRYASYPAP
jgi:transposase